MPVLPGVREASPRRRRVVGRVVLVNLKQTRANYGDVTARSAAVFVREELRIKSLKAVARFVTDRSW